jgi:HEAT repeat protein
VWRFLALLVALMAGVCAAIWYYRSPEFAPAPQRVERPADRFLHDLDSRNPREVERAEAEVRQLGTAALPIIRAALTDQSAPEARRKAALKAAALLGPSGAEIVPDVATLLNEAPYTAEAALALSFMGSAAVQPLKEAVTSDDAAVRREALRSLGKLRGRASTDPKVVLPLLVDAVGDPDPSVREIAVTYLGIVRDDPEHEVDVLIKALDDEAAEVRRGAAMALGEYGPLAAAAMPALRKAARDPDEDVQREAGRALVQITERQEPTASGRR